MAYWKSNKRVGNRALGFSARKAALLDFFGHLGIMQQNVNTTFKYHLIKFLWRKWYHPINILSMMKWSNIHLEENVHLFYDF